jgi:hypothetical protein
LKECYDIYLLSVDRKTARTRSQTPVWERICAQSRSFARAGQKILFLKNQHVFYPADTQSRSFVGRRVPKLELGNEKAGAWEREKLELGNEKKILFMKNQHVFYPADMQSRSFVGRRVPKLELGNEKKAGAWEREKLELGNEKSWSLGTRNGGLNYGDWKTDH